MRSQERFTQPARQRRSFSLALGVALPFLAGVGVWAIPAAFGSGDMFDAPWPYAIIVTATGVCALASGYLVRSWWAALIAPVSWLVGEMAAFAVALPVINALVPASLQSPLPWWQIYLMTSVVMLVAGGGANAGLALIGILIQRWRSQRAPSAPPAEVGA